ncbi:amidohydrolase [Phytohabitans suffuscus]|uniref:Amidohydrolase n=1 Tax=Phytohabitans suffuscus TaxID=624315 RepID=A0A6F8YXP0_9ACTN|nr:amidohydrolase family protein [Phytohabitans suffuscus]BCB90601.1 amidohydrolase [Phytohabitans suffuscus]
MTATATLYRDGSVYSPVDPTATALLVRDGVIVWVGPDADAPPADVTVDLDGALVTPAFVDAHVHATDTGLALSGLDLSGARSGAEVLAAVAGFAEGLPGDAVVLGHGWDETTWDEQVKPDAAALERAAGGRRAYLSQASIHSALCTPSLLVAARGAAGFDESGWVRREAHHVVRELALGSIPAVQRTRAQRVALERAAALGVAAVHECGGPGTSSEADFTGLLALSGQGLPEVYGYWGELLGAAKAKELGAVGAGGDLYADGALGSQTAHLSESYLDTEGCGHGYVSAEQVRDHLLDCAAHGIQGGFHAIGDAAIGTVLAGFREAAGKLGVERLRDARHRVEHAEIMSKRLIAGFVEYGIVASVQPAFDRLWGGESQMYAQRLGVRRSLDSNPMGAMHGVGVALAFGSDSPVTPLDPWGSVRAAVRHFNPVQRMSVRAAFAAHTRGGWRAVHRDGEGVLSPGAPATFAVWSFSGGLSKGLPELEELPVCRRTVLRGDVIFEG